MAPRERRSPIAAPKPLHILIVDDHTLITDMLELFLGQLGRPVRVSKAASVPQALALARTADDLALVLLDLHMPDMDGLAGLRHLKRERPDVPVVILTGDVTAAAAELALTNGASGFIGKTVGGPGILHALQRVLAGERYVPSDLHNLVAARPAGNGGDGLLSRREQGVLDELIEGRSNKEISHRLGIAVVTVSLHLRNIYRKLQVKGRTQAVRRGLELRQRPPAPGPGA